MKAITTPVKAFFVEVITKDISLDDAILDLLDNCIDGILRVKGVAGSTPFSGFSAEITFDKTSFRISDNCGGFDRKTAEQYAFRFGRPRDRKGDEKLTTVGIYGIGMKRAIFKMGRSAVVETRNGTEKTKVVITPDWIDDEKDWLLPITDGTMKTEGTTVSVGTLEDIVSARFDSEEFEDDLIDRISEHYAYIIDQGFKVSVNGRLVKPKPIGFYWDESGRSEAIRPYVYKTEWKGVSVYLTVGLWQPPKGEGEIEQAQRESWTKDLAGWTVVCNHRVVAYCDKTALTGWVQPIVPRYHGQFSGIRGYVEFVSKDASKLPTNSTKHGLDSNSELYLKVQTQMIKGTKEFTDFTNAWKGATSHLKKVLTDTKSKTISEIKAASRKLPMRKATNDPLKGEVYRPKLPKAPKISSDFWIRFSKPEEEVEEVAEYFDVEPKEAGISAFEDALRRARS